MYRTDFVIGECINEGFELFKKDAGLLILCGLVATLVSALTAGILGGPLYAGLLMVCLALYERREPKPQVGNLFRGFDYFLQTFLFWLVWAFIIAGGALLLSLAATVLAFLPIIGWVLTPLLQVIIGLAASCVAPAFLMFGLFFIIEDQMEFWPASMRSIELVRQNPWSFIGLFAIVALIGMVGTAVCCVGVFFTTPIQAAIITVTYRRIFPEESHFDQTISSPPPPPPPGMNTTDFT